MTASGAPAATADAALDPAPARCARRPLGTYTDPHGRRREIVMRPGAYGSVLVIDEDAQTLGDRRLVAHLPCDEPAANAVVVSRLYLADPHGRIARAVVPDDWRRAPGAAPRPDAPPAGSALVDARQCAFRLAVRTAAWGGGELRWTAADPPGETTGTVGLRDVVGALEAYEPACAMTEHAVRRPPDPLISTLALAGELERLRRSRTVLNRPLREAVQQAVDDGLSLSQIAARCGRHKSRRTAPRVGDTSWLGRRIGLVPEAGRDEPSPWIDTDVLALIAREGLGLDPRQVEPA
jgi:hypothetical protein